MATAHDRDLLLDWHHRFHLEAASGRPTAIIDDRIGYGA
jgi:hypothetical protein